MLNFEWDERKAHINKIKHRVSFEESRTVFDDDNAVYFDDDEHSFGEQRETVIGFSSQARLLTISFVERTGNVRIISSRISTPQERQRYATHY